MQFVQAHGRKDAGSCPKNGFAIVVAFAPPRHPPRKNGYGIGINASTPPDDLFVRCRFTILGNLLRSFGPCARRRPSAVMNASYRSADWPLPPLPPARARAGVVISQKRMNTARALDGDADITLYPRHAAVDLVSRLAAVARGSASSGDTEGCDGSLGDHG